MFSRPSRCLHRKPKTFAVNVEGRLRPGVTRKGFGSSPSSAKSASPAGTGPCVRISRVGHPRLVHDERMTVCNMSIEGRRTRRDDSPPNDTTFAYLEGKPRAPKGACLGTRARARWRLSVTDPGAVFDASVDIDASLLDPMITYGTIPRHGAPDRRVIPDKAGDEAFRQSAALHGGFTAAMPCSASRST